MEADAAAAVRHIAYIKRDGLSLERVLLLPLSRFSRASVLRHLSRQLARSA